MAKLSHSTMSEQSGSMIYEFGPYSADKRRRRLMRDGEAVALTAKAFDTLIILLERRGSIVSKQDLMDVIWPDTAVEENNLTQQISTLRKALGESSADRRFIVTLPGKGYSFVAEVTEQRYNETNIISAPVSMDRAARFSRWASRMGFQPVTAAVVVFLLLLTVVFWSNLRRALSPAPPTIAVLPFHSPDGSEDAFGAGMSNTLTAKLGNLEELKVRPSNPLMRSGGADPLIAGRELNVDAVLDGTVQRDNGQVRVTVQMLDVADGRVLWGESFNRRFSDMFSAQDSITAEVVELLHRHMTPQDPGSGNFNSNNSRVF